MEKEKRWNVTVGEDTRSWPDGTAYAEIAAEYQDQMNHPVLLVMANGRLRELHHTVTQDTRLLLLTIEDRDGFRTYQRSCSMLFLSAVYHVGGYDKIRRVVLHFSIEAGFYYTIEGDVEVNEEFLRKVELHMWEIVDRDLPIRKRSVRTQEAIDLFRRYRMKDKEQLFRTRLSSTVNLYRLGEYEDYYYGYMAHSTGALNRFRLHLYQEGIVLQMPKRSDPLSVPELHHQKKLFKAQRSGEIWAEQIGIDTVGALNANTILQKSGDTILLAEALQESRLAEIANRIEERGGVKFVMIAGPSSSGKTTFSHRLCVQLATRGLKPHYIGVDNYFVNREDTPLDADGKKDYECLEAIDLAGFQSDMSALLAGETVAMPTYDFLEGKRVYKGNTITLGKEDLLVIEGIHCLNDRLGGDLPSESKYKIYISALTQLNLDEHNRIPTTDGRLIRRMVRDNRTRGHSASATLGMWDSVRRGEEKHIFPYQESADYVFNSALPYELAVLKQYVQPLLFQVDEKDPMFTEARRLLKFLDYFLPIPADDIPNDSILREFIGGGVYKL